MQANATSHHPASRLPRLAYPDGARATFTTVGRLAGSVLLPLLLLSGCQTTHEVTVDAISRAERPAGSAYHLEVHDPSGGVDTGVLTLVTSSVEGALGTRGLYMVPAATRPDMVIHLVYGVGQGHIQIVNHQNSDIMLGGYVGPTNDSKAVVVYNKFIEISAREPDPSPTLAPGPKPRPSHATDELWNVHATIEDPSNELAPYIEVLVAASLDYLGENSGREVKVPLKSDQARALLARRASKAAGK